MKKHLLLALLLSPIFVFAQLTGTVNDNNNVALPYVNVYVENTSIGTTTNNEGVYSLKLEPGQYTIVYQFIGYKTHKASVNIKNQAVKEDVILFEESYSMPEVVISANAEDPAYAIIRKAQNKRKYYGALLTNYECDAYVRGFNKILKAPEKILGVEIGDLDGTLDSTRQGVVYLSESVSKLYSFNGKKKEVMYSSKISGNDQGYSFNSAKEMEFNFYENQIDLETKKIVSPIANSAMTYYDYKLEGAHYDDNGQLVNKIKVIPKNAYGPAFYGHIYINEDLWNINSLELWLTKNNLQIDIIDSLIFKQTFIPISNDQWMPFSNVVKFKLTAFGFEVGGNFACVYSNYNIEDINTSVFNREVFKVQEEANQRTEMYWDSIRPIPLTKEERIDYVRKDSIRIVKESPEYLDSIDKINNTFKFGNIINGYSYQNSIKRTNWNISTPLTEFNINTIQGLHGSFGLGYNKRYDKKNTKNLKLDASVNYGLSEKKWRPKFSAHYRANRKNNLNFALSGGKDLSQINRTNPIGEKLNTVMTYVFRRNYLKAYDKTFLSVGAGQNLGPLLGLKVSFDYEDRESLSNSFDNSLAYKDTRIFTPNIPQFENHKAFIFRASMRFKIGEEIWSYPDSDFRVGSAWPTLWVHYKKGINAFDADTEFDLLHATINKRYSVGLWGDFNFHIHGGVFLNEPTQFIDQMHFTGNQTHIGNPSNYWNRFLIMPYYGLSTSQEFVELHLGHNFKGSILGKLPIFKKLGWHLAGGVKHLRSGSHQPYSEFHIGLDNLGWHIFRLFRVDAVWNNYDTRLTNPFEGHRFGIVVGVKMDL